MKKRILAVLLAGLLALSATACSSEAGNSSSAPSSSKAETVSKVEESQAVSETNAGGEQKSVKVMAPDMDEKSIAQWELLEPELGMEIEFLTAAGDQYAQKVNTMMATGEVVDLITCEDSLPWRSWAEDDLIVGLDTLIDPSKHVYSDKITSSDLFKGYLSDGNRYVLPNAHHGCDWTMVVRKDIMEQIGNPEINTMEDYYDAMVKAKELGYIGLGVNLEDGLVKLQTAFHIFAYYGGGGIKPDGRTLDINDGVVSDLSVSEGSKEALLFLNRLYREGLMNKDYATIKDGFTSTYVDSGKVFSLYTPAGNIPAANQKMQTLDPNYEYEIIPAIGADRPEFRPMTQGFNMWRISFVPSTAENPQGGLDLFELANSRVGREILIGGEKGVTMTEEGFTEDGVFTLIPENCEEVWGNSTGISPRWWGLMSTVYGYIPVEKYDTYEEAYANEMIFVTSQDMESDNPFSNVLGEIALPIESEVRPNLNNIRGEYWNKMITASSQEEAEALWDEYVSTWENGGGADYVAAYQEYYDANF